MEGSAPLPNFLIIGAQKSATRWLRTHLGEHPDIFTADHEISFFTGHFRKGPDWYRQHFASHRNETWIGEATPAYMMWKNPPARIADRILETLGPIKLFALLRNPVDRTYSAFVHHVRAGRIRPEFDLFDRLDAIEPEEDPLFLITGSWYARSLLPFIEKFRDQLQVIVHDDILARPQETFSSALNHLGIKEGFVPENLSKIKNHGKLPPGSPHAKSKSGERRELSSNDRRKLFSFFEDDVKQLERLLHRDLSFWRPG